jgi:uroporphyrinogen decarboxylase
MNSRERILVTLTHHEPDRVPVDFGATPSSGISAIAYNSLIEYLGLSNSRTRVYDTVQELAQPETPVLELFHADALDIQRAFDQDDSLWYPVSLADGSMAEYPIWTRPVKQTDGSYHFYDPEGTLVGKKPVGGTFYDGTCYPYENGYPDHFRNLQKDMQKSIWAAMVMSPGHLSQQPDYWSILREGVLHLRESSDKALIIGLGCNLFEWGSFLRRMDNFLMDLYLDPLNVERLLDGLMEIHLSKLEKICAAIGDLVDFAKFGDDLGMDSGPFMDPSVYRAFFKPRHKMLTEFVRQHSGMHPFLHSCGSIYQLIPDLIDAGFEVLNPVQTNATGMDPMVLKSEFGRDITFWGGGIDTRKILNFGTPGEVKDQVKKRLEVFSKNGGYVFNTIHNILPDVPPRNIVSMFEAVDEFNGLR